MSLSNFRPKDNQLIYTKELQVTDIQIVMVN